MSLLPLLTLAEELGRIPSPTPDYFYPEPIFYYRSPYLTINPRERQHLRNQQRETSGTISSVGKDGFQVCMDVTQFKPSELNVKVVDNEIVVEGKHEEREDDHGYISRHFVRRYALPKGYDADKVASTLSSDGILTVSVPKPAIADKSNERQIQIQQVGPAHLNVKENPKDEDKNKKEQEVDKKKTKA